MNGIKHVCIVGIGLIGGSIGLALKEYSPGIVVIGHVRNAPAGSRAIELGIVDMAEQEPAAAVSQADVVFLASPPAAIKDNLQQIAPFLKPGCLVTDVASTKMSIMKWAEAYLPAAVDFVGGHPMAGKEVSGMEAAEAGLFNGCTYCLVPGKDCSDHGSDLAEGLARGLGGRPLFLTAEEHDEAVAGISHLPLVLASILVRATTDHRKWELMSQLAASGYRDSTRLALQHPAMNRDICLTNGDMIKVWLDTISEEIARFRELIDRGDPGALERAFEEAGRARRTWWEGYAKKSPR